MAESINRINVNSPQKTNAQTNNFDPNKLRANANARLNQQKMGENLADLILKTMENSIKQPQHNNLA